MENQIIQQAEKHIKELIKQGLTDDHLYHDLSHTLSVRDASLAIGNKYQLSAEELEILELAALFHDTGFTKQYELHEDFSKEIATDFLTKQNYPKDKIKHINELIDATQIGVVPTTLLQKILKDADFNSYEKSYLQNAKALRHEWVTFRGQKMTDEEWLENNLIFWTGHTFYTDEAEALFGKEKKKAIKKFKKQMDKMSKKEKKKKETADDNFSLNSSKAAQMMFKTTEPRSFSEEKEKAHHWKGQSTCARGE